MILIKREKMLFKTGLQLVQSKIQQCNFSRSHARIMREYILETRSCGRLLE